MNKQLLDNPSDHLVAWGGNFKAISDEGILEGNGIVFGSENKPDKSIFRDFFTSDTFVHPENEFTTTLLFEHAFKRMEPIGKATMYKTENGWDVIAELNLSDPFVKEKFEEIKAEGGWGFSTGAIGHALDREKKANDTHFIKQWVVGEISITKTPAEPDALVRNVKSLYSKEILPDSQTDEEYESITELGENPTIDKLIDIIKFLIGRDCKSKNLNDENELTVLKSAYEELETKYEDLQSSFNEKEALLSEKVALLSELEESKEPEEVKSKDNDLEDNSEKLEELKQKWMEEFKSIHEEELNLTSEKITILQNEVNSLNEQLTSCKVKLNEQKKLNKILLKNSNK